MTEGTDKPLSGSTRPDQPERWGARLALVSEIARKVHSKLEMGELLNGKSFDDRVGVFVMIEAMRAAGSNKMDIYAVGSTQEEIGIRGATVAARNIDPDIGIAVDITLASDLPRNSWVQELGSPHSYKPDFDNRHPFEA